MSMSRLLAAVAAGCLVVAAGPEIETAFANYALIPGSSTMLQPASGAPGTPVTVGGSGLRPGRLYYPEYTDPDGDTIVQIGPEVQAGADGRLTVRGTIPANSELGKGIIDLHEVPSCDYSWPINFVVT